MVKLSSIFYRLELIVWLQKIILFCISVWMLKKAQSKCNEVLKCCLWQVDSKGLVKQSSSKHCLSVLNQLNQQRLSNQFCDVTLLIEGEEYKAHKSVLAASSEYFRELFIEKGAVTSHEAVVDLSGELLWVSKLEIIIS